MPITGHRNSYSVIKGQLPYGKVLLLFHATIQLYHILIPNARGILEFFIGGSGGGRSRGPRIKSAMLYQLSYKPIIKSYCYSQRTNLVGCDISITPSRTIQLYHIQFGLWIGQMKKSLKKIRMTFFLVIPSITNSTMPISLTFVDRWESHYNPSPNCTMNLQHSWEMLVLC